MIKVVHHTKGVGYSGTDRTAQIMCKYLDATKFDPYILYRTNADCSRLQQMNDFLGEGKLIKYDHEHGDNKSPYLPRYDNFIDALKMIKPDIVHFHRSGYPEWPCLPFLKEEFPGVKFVETNIFANNDAFPWDLRLFISKHIAAKAGYPHGEVLYNPIERALRLYDRSMDYPNDLIILGRIGRPDNFCDISLRAIRILLDRGVNNFIYKVINPCERWVEVAKELNVEDVCQFLGPIYSDEDLSNFYNSIDILAHARADGECNSVTIGEAQMHGIPIVSHISPCYNGHIEQIENSKCGFYSRWQDAETYADALERLIRSIDLRLELSENGYRWAMENIEASIIVKKLERYYRGVLDV